MSSTFPAATAATAAEIITIGTSLNNSSSQPRHPNHDSKSKSSSNRIHPRNSGINNTNIDCKSHTCEPVENSNDPPLRWKRGVEKVIGEGSFGKVYLGLNEATGEMIAVKQIYLNENNKKDMTELMKEIQLIQHLDHPNIVKFLGTSRTDDRLFILLEYASGGSIANVINQFGPMNESLIRLVNQKERLLFIICI
jgi:hypothetical protein